MFCICIGEIREQQLINFNWNYFTLRIMLDGYYLDAGDTTSVQR